MGWGGACVAAKQLCPPQKMDSVYDLLTGTCLVLIKTIIDSTLIRAGHPFNLTNYPPYKFMIIAFPCPLYETVLS